MSLLTIIKSFFESKPKTPYEECVKIIRKMGYKRDGEGCFLKENSSGRTMIWVTENGIKIKVYAGGYAESDFLPAPLPNVEKLKRFIRENEL